MSNETLAHLIEGQLDRAASLVMSALKVAKLRGRLPLSVSEVRQLEDDSLRCEVDHVVLVGGLTRLRPVAEKISRMFPESKIHTVPNPQEMVALGLTYGRKLESVNLPRPPVNLNIVVGDQKETVYGAFSPLYHPNDLYLYDTLAKRIELPNIVNLGDSFLQCESPTRDKRTLKMSIMVLHDHDVLPNLWWDKENSWELVDPELVNESIDFLVQIDQRRGRPVYDEENFDDLADFWRGMRNAGRFDSSVFIGSKFYLPGANPNGFISINVNGKVIIATAGGGQVGYRAVEMKILFWPLRTPNSDGIADTGESGTTPRVITYGTLKPDLPDSNNRVAALSNHEHSTSTRETNLSMDGLTNFFGEVERLANDLYQIKSKPNFHGLTHLAIDTLMRDYELNEEEIADELIDGVDETELEYFEITEDDVPKVIFIRSVRGDLTSRAQADQLSLMIHKVQNLRERKTQRGITDPVERTRFLELQKVRNLDPEFVYILLVLENRKSPVIGTDSLFDEVLRPGFDTAFVYGEEQIVEKYCANGTDPNTNTDVKFTIKRDALFQHFGASSSHLAQMLIGADEYVRETYRHGSNLFRLNPRLFLSKAAGPNKAMLNTLESDGVSRFHIFNNGITGVCDELAITDTGDTVQISVKNLQIVNGCQTTETLWSWARRAENAGDALVPLRIVESRDETLVRQISMTTNSQSAIAAADLVANDDLQKSMKVALEGLGIFYEARRGEWRQASEAKRDQIKHSNTFWIPGGLLRINLREMGQALLAVSGKPNQAKEQIAGLFKDQHRETYKTLFGESWTGEEQVALLAGLYLYLKDIKSWCGDAASPDYKKVASLGRFYIIYLIYEYWRQGSKAFVGESRGQGQEKLLDATQSLAHLNNFDTAAISKLANLAVKALVHTRENAKPAIDGNRALLRQGAHKEAIEDRFRLLLDAQL